MTRAGSLRWTEDEWREHCLRKHADVNSVAAPRRQPRGGIVERVYERDVLKGVLRALELHPRVAWAARMNVVAQKIDDRFVRAGFPGLSDVVGMLRDGRFLAVEVKRPGGQPTTAQVEFLGLVSRSGGVAFVARSVEDVMRGLADEPRAA
ncbi:MAG TPA: VRR-NUC domain-containing protein [Casimicrobiaceae bacterium]|nr:VRR-NUC domain-containing protein [Casimicrobiaceae bacterium]